MHKSQQQPWLNEDGRVKSDAELRKAGQQWPPGVWENYLATLEIGRREEDVLSPAVMDTFAEEKRAIMLFSMASQKNYPLLKFALNASIHTLSSRQKEIVISHYWDNKTIAEIALGLRITEQSVRKTMKTALAKLRTCMTNSSLMRHAMLIKKMIAS